MSTQLKQKKWRYKPSQKLRKHIERWEGSDFAKQNKLFGGDAIAAKAIEFSNIMGNRGKYFTLNELDGMFSTYYNLAPDTFNQRFMSLIDNYVNDTSPQNLLALKDSMADRWVLAKNIHKRGIRNRAASDVSLMGNSDYVLPDSRTALFPLLKSIKQSLPEVHIAQPDALVVDKPILPIKLPAQTAYSAPNLQEVYDIFNDAAVAYGNESMLPSVNDLLKEGKTKYFANILGMPSLYDQDSSGYDVRPFLVAKDGKLPGYANGLWGSIKNFFGRIGRSFGIIKPKGKSQPKSDEIRSIPEVVVTPDPELRRRVNETWPNKEVREQALKEISTFKKTAEREYYYGKDYPSSDFYDDPTKNSGGAAFMWTKDGLPANYEVERAMDLVNASGNPDVYVFRDKGGLTDTTNRSFYLFNGDEPGIHISTADYRDPYFSELSHAYQLRNGLYKYGEHTEHASDDYSAYHDPTNVEYLAHEIIQPEMYTYLRGPKEFDLDYMNRSIERHVKNAKSSYKNGKLPRYEDGTPADATWHENWLNSRLEQFNENVSLKPRKFNKLGVDTVEGQINNLKNTEETSDTVHFKDATGNSAPFMYKQYGIGAMAFPKADGSGNIIWYSPSYSGKPYEPLTLEKSYNKDMTLEDIDRWNSNQRYELAPEEEVMATKTHERTHALSPFDPTNPANTGLLPLHEKIRRINKEMGITSTKTDGHTSLYDNDAYRNDVEETYAGIMQLRYELGLDPKHHVEMDEIQEWRDKGLLNEYLVGKPNEVLYRYFNDVAYNTDTPSKGDIVYAKNGKLPRLKPKRR